MASNTDSAETAVGALSTSVNSHIVDTDSDEGILSSYSLPILPDSIQYSERQQSLMTRSQYALVVFHGIDDIYPTDSDIVCRYSLTDGVEAAPGDRIVLFAVGWSSMKDYIVFDWAPMPEKGERHLSVVFKAADLPKDTNEFYQVCYVSNEGAVCGASVPFQVRIPNNDELTFALEEDMVVVRSSTAVAQDKLLKAQLHQESLTKKKADLEIQLRSLEDKHNLTLQRLDQLQETLSTSNSLNEELNKENAELREINNEMLHVKEQLRETQNMLDAATRDKKHMQEEIKALTAATEEYKLTITNSEKNVKQSEQRLIAAVEQIELLRKAQETSQDKMVTMSKNLENIENARTNLTSTNFALENELTLCKFNLNNTQLENVRLETELEKLGKQRKELDEQLKNASQLAEIHRTYCEQYSANGNSSNGRLIMENTKLLRMTEDLQLRISTLEQEKCTLEQVLGDTLDAQKCSCRENCKPGKDESQFESRHPGASINMTVDEELGSSSLDRNTSSESQVATLTKWLDESLKANQLNSQEMMALRIQNEILETTLAENNSKSNEYVLVSKADSPVSTSQNSSVVDHRYIILNTENEKLTERLNEYSNLLIEKDIKLNNMHRDMEALRNEFSEAKKEFKLQIDNLTSRNASLVEQERGTQELKDEMQRITFMNGELLAQNAALMDRVHNSKGKMSTKIESNLLQEAGNSQCVDSTLESENSQLRKQLEFAYENFNQTWKRIGKVGDRFEQHDSCNKDNELVFDEKRTSRSEDSQCLLPTDKHDILSQQLDSTHSQIENKHYREHLVEPKLKQISQDIENVLSAVKQLASSSVTTERNGHCSVDAHELKHRLMMAREEYEKLHATMVHYKTKYNELKIRYKAKKGVTVFEHISA